MEKANGRHAVLIDFGSTYTKVAVADLQTKTLLHTNRFPSTVATDARIGLGQCFEAAREALGEEAFQKALKLSSSSAAGGLRMGVVGLTLNLSLSAGRNAAFGAGAKILHTTTGLLNEEEIRALEALPLEILLFCGGYEKGNTSVLEHNARLLAQSALRIPVIYAGNSMAAPYVRSCFVRENKELYLVDNIIPGVGELHTPPVEKIIREVFLKRIINMKGLDVVAGQLDRMVMPTPAAVLCAGELLSRGCARHQGLGGVMIVDVGGATTDIHSYIQQTGYEGAKVVGARESYAKRTVEGDLGMREGSGSLAQELGLSKLAKEANLSEAAAQSVLQKWQSDHEALAQTPEEIRVDTALAQGAVALSARRHAGYIEHISSAGLKKVQHGKNLTGIGHIIGTGGPLVFGKNPKEALLGACRNPQREPDILLPRRAQCYLDKEYVFFAAGLLREVNEEAAFLLMKNSLQEV